MPNFVTVQGFRCYDTPDFHILHRLSWSPLQHGVALTGRNRTGPPCNVGRPTATRPAAGPPAGSVTDDDRRRQQTTDASEQNNTGPLGGPVTM